MQRYFVKEKNNNTFLLTKEDSHHVIDVMRMKLNEKIEVVYEEKLYICEITSLDTTVECKIVEEIEVKHNIIPRVIIAQALVKEQKMDYILQKACELGAYKIIPITTIRSVVKYTDKDSKKIIRWNKILKEAGEQNKRVNIPILEEVMSLKDLINVDASIKLICSLKEKEKTIKSILSKINNSDTIICVIGSEGGIDPSEEDFLVNNGFTRVSLGNNVLRTETASSFVLSAVNYEFMR